MATPIFLTGFEAGLLSVLGSSAGTTNPGAWVSITDSATAGATLDIVTSVFHTGTRSLRIVTPGDATAHIVIREVPAGNDVVVVRVYFRFESVPAADTVIAVWSNGATAIARLLVTSTGRIGALVPGGTMQTSAVVATGEQHWIDVRVNTTAATWTIDWQVDGVAQTQATGAGTAGLDIVRFGMGQGTSTAGSQITTYYDDLLISVTSGDYPIGKGGTWSAAPGRDGTHNIVTANAFDTQDTAGVNITNATTTAYQMVDDAPPWSETRSTTDDIRQDVIAGAEYVEVGPASGGAPIQKQANHVRAMLHYSSPGGAGTDLAGCVVRNSTPTETAIWGDGTTRQNYDVQSNNWKGVMVTVPAAGWTAAEVEAVRWRLGYATDVTPIPTWQALLLEVEYPPITVTLGQATETDTAQVIVRAPTGTPVAQVTELDTAQAVSVRKTRALTQVTETDTAQVIVVLKTRALGQALETDTAQATTPRKSVTLGQTVETDTAQTVTINPQRRLVNQVTEVDTAQAVVPRKTLAISQVTELDTAQAVTRRKTAPLGQATETDTVQVVGRLKTRVLAQITETDTAQSVVVLKTRAVAQVTETDTAQAVSVNPQRRLVNQVTETDAAQVVTPRKSALLGQVTEVDTAQAVTVRKTRVLGQVVETDLAQTITRAGVGTPVAQTTEVDTAQAVAVNPQRRLVGQASEVDLAQTITARKTRAVAQVNEADLAQTVTARKLATTGQTAETDTAQGVTRRKTLAAGQTLELDMSQVETVAKRLALAQPIELDLAQAVVVVGPNLVQQTQEVDAALAVLGVLLLHVGVTADEVQVGLLVGTTPVEVQDGLSVGTVVLESQEGLAVGAVTGEAQDGLAVGTTVLEVQVGDPVGAVGSEG